MSQSLLRSPAQQRKQTIGRSEVKIEDSPSISEVEDDDDQTYRPTSIAKIPSRKRPVKARKRKSYFGPIKKRKLAKDQCNIRGSKRITSKLKPEVTGPGLNFVPMEENHPSTVTVTTLVKDNESNLKTWKIDLLSHCIFCLRKTAKYQEPLKTSKELIECLQVVPQSKSLPHVAAFNRIWSILKEAKENSSGLDEDKLFDIFGGSSTHKKTIFEELPVVCQFCSEKVETTIGLMRQVAASLNDLHRIIQDSKYNGKHSWRAQMFENDLRSSISASATMEFLDFQKNTTVISDLKQAEACTSSPETRAPTPDNFDTTMVFGVDQLNGVAMNGPAAQSVTPNRSPEDDDSYNASDHFMEFMEEDTEHGNDIQMDHEIKQEPVKNSSLKPSRETRDHNSSSSCSTRRSNRNSTKVDYAFTNISVARPDPNKNVTFTVSWDPTTKKKSYICIIDGCGQSFSDKAKGLNAHHRKHKNTSNQKKIPCHLCSETFPTQSSFQKHLRSNHPKIQKPAFPGQKCDLCNERIPLANIYKHARDHISSIGEEYLIKCLNPKCPFIFFRGSSLSRHIWGDRRTACSKYSAMCKEASKLRNVCETCGFSSEKACYLRSHINAVHETSTKNFHCPINNCQQKFTMKQSVFLHLPHHDFHQNLESQKCDHCGIICPLNKMEFHLKEAHQVQEIIKCTQCPLLFSSREQLVDHMHSHRFGTLSCDICNDLKFSGYASFHNHYLKVHNIGSKLQCDQCKSSFWKKETLERHKLVNHKNPGGPPVERFQCDECSDTFKSRQLLDNHKVLAHGANPFSCKLCDETLYKKEHYLRHMKVHKGVKLEKEREFKCEVEGCDKMYFGKRALEVHYATIHLGEREHVCEQCGKAFRRPQCLKSHVEIAHLGKRCVCEICGEAFCTTGVLKNHMRIHTGERPFACEICGQRFRQKEVLKRHIEAHERKGEDFKPNGPMKQIRKRVEKST